MSGHFRVSAPGFARYTDTLGGPRRATRWHQANETVRISARIGPLFFAGPNSLLHELLQRKIAVGFRVDADQMTEGGNTISKFTRLFTETTVIKKPARLSVVHELDVGIGGVAVVDGNPGAAGTH